MRFLVKYPITIFIVILVLYSVSTKIYAVSNSSISINITPESPVPEENVKINLTSYASNLDSVLISWFVNNKKISSGIGEKSFSTKAPSVGAETMVRALISLPDGEIEKAVTIASSVMVLLYEAMDSYTPPFYRGKAMPTSESEIKVVALPEIRNKTGLLNPKNMTYAWQKNFNNDIEGSGYSKNFFIYIKDYLEDVDNIAVTASTTDQRYSSRGNINIGASRSEISFYRNDSRMGTIFEQALTNGHRMVEEKEIIVAEPYFISPKEIQTPRLTWSWYINGTAVPILSGYRKNVIPLRVENGVSGTSTLRLEIESQDQILETASKEINIEY